MYDPVQDVLEAIGRCNEVRNARLANNFLNNVGEVFERDGFGTTRAFLIEKRERPDLRDQANALLKVLEIMQDCKEIQQRRAIGRTIIKGLIAHKMSQTHNSDRGGHAR